MKKLFLIALSFSCITTLFAADSAVKGKVVKYPLNVRAGAGTKYTALMQLDKDYEVTITAVSAKWLMIKPPENTQVWVMKEYIRNGKLTANVNLRSGPSTGYEAVGFGRRNTKVTVQGKPTKSGWIKINAPDDIDLYAGRPAIKVAPKDLQKLPRFKVPTGKPLPNTELINLEGNFTSAGKDISVTGYVYEEKKSHLKSVSHVFYQLKGQDELIPRYLVMPNRTNLNRFKDKKVRLIGEYYKVKGWQLPLLIVKIARSAE